MTGKIMAYPQGKKIGPSFSQELAQVTDDCKKAWRIKESA